MKPWIIGLNNPHSPRPRDALVPWPGGCAGHRLVQMAQLADPTFDATEYLDSFERRNLWPGVELPKGVGSAALYRREAAKLQQEIARSNPRALLLLGLRVFTCVAGVQPPCKFGRIQRGGRDMWYLPHPSSLCRVYNSELNRAIAGRILVDVARARLRVVGGTAHGNG